MQKMGMLHFVFQKQRGNIKQGFMTDMRLTELRSMEKGQL